MAQNGMAGSMCEAMRLMADRQQRPGRGDRHVLQRHLHDLFPLTRPHFLDELVS